MQRTAPASPGPQQGREQRSPAEAAASVRCSEKGKWASSPVTKSSLGLQGRPGAHLDDEASGRALPDPEAEFPLFPLPQLPLCARGNEHRVLINQGFV